METIKIHQQTLDEINAHAVKEYPRECCGWIIQQKNGQLSYHAAENLQDKYHRLDPETYPRSSKDAFLMDTLKLNRAIEEAQLSGGTLFSIVHSHIDCEAYFSEEDEIQMSTPDKTGPVFPAKCYLVVSIREKKPSGSAAFVYSGSHNKFLAANLVVE